MATYREIEPFVQMIDAQSQSAGGPAMSKFEVLTAMAFAAFADAPVDVAVVEVGLGGRWDATNVINAPVAVITPIGIDHVEYLGDDIADIAGGEGRHHRQGRALTVHRTPSRSSRGRCPRRWRCCWRKRCAPTPRSPARIPSSRCWAVRSPIGGQVLQLQGLGGVYSDIFLPLHGEHQAHNAVRGAGGRRGVFRRRRRSVSSTSTLSGPGSPPSPAPAGWSGCAARQRCSSTPRTIRRVQPRWRRRWPSEFDFRFLVGVLSVMADKDVDGILAALEPVFDPVVVTHNGSPRALDVESLALAAQERFGPDRVVTAENLRDAIDIATALVDDAAPRATRSFLRHRDRHHRLGGHRRGRAHPVWS